MKKVYTFILSGAAILAVAACNKEMQVEENPQNNEPVYETLSVKVGAETKVTLETGATKSAFESGDKIAVWTGAGAFQSCTVDGEGKISVNISGGARSNYAVYYNGATIPTFESSTLKLTLPDTYNYDDVAGDKNPVPMVAKNVSSDPADMTFYAVGTLFRVTVKAIPSDATGLVFQFPGNKVNGTFTVTDPGTDAPYIATGTGTPKPGQNQITIDLSELSTPHATEMTLNIPLPTGNYDDVFITPVSSTKVAAVRHIKAGGYTANRARGRQLTATLVSFSVSAEKKVIFSPGNLQATYDGSAWAWHFADHQYDFIGNGGDSTVGNEMLLGESPWISGPGTVDLFSFSSNKEGNYYGIHNNPLPGDGDSWSVAYYGSFKDWGTNSIDGYAADTWRTLTGVADEGEWNYLLATRSKKFAPAVVAGVGGLIILPDVFTDPNTNTAATTAFKPYVYPNDRELNVYTAGASWDAMENAGAVFLPAAARRLEDGKIQVGTTGHYWSSTGIGEEGANRMYFTNNNYWTATTGYRYHGLSVRLVRDLN